MQFLMQIMGEGAILYVNWYTISSSMKGEMSFKGYDFVLVGGGGTLLLYS